MKFLSALRSPLLWPWLIILPGAILRMWHLGSSSPLWYDEAYTAILARLPLDRMMAAVAGDVHPPLYYLLVWLVVHLVGSAPAALRVLSAVIAIWTLIDFHLLTAELGLSRRAALIALAIMAYLPLNLYYAQEARMYALLQWLIIMQLRTVLQRNWMKFGVFTLLALYTHNYALFYTAIIALIAVGREIARPIPVYRAGIDDVVSCTGIIPLWVSLSTATVFWLPWYSVLLRQMAAIQGNYWLPQLSLGSALHAVYMILAGNMPDSLVPLTAFSLFAGLLLLGISGLRKPRHLSLVLLAFGPLGLAVIGSLLWQPLILYRGLIGMAAPLAALAGIALASTTRRGVMVGMALLAPFSVGMLWLLAAGEVGMAKMTLPYPTYRAGPPVVHLDDATLIFSQDTTGYLLDAGCPEEAGSLSPVTRQAMGIRRVSLSELPHEFIFSARLFPLSTACHERVVAQLTRSAEVVDLQQNELSLIGVWYAKNR